MDPVSVGKLINKLRTEKNLTQKQLAEMLNLTDKAVSKWERGECCPDLPIMIKLAEIFGIDLPDLANGDVEDFSQPEFRGKKIRMYDFRRPSRFLKYEFRKIANIFEVLSQEIEKAFGGIIQENFSVHITSVDELTNEEFIRSIPTPSFNYIYNYNKKGFAIEVDPILGKTILKQDIARYPKITNLDLEILHHYYIDKMAQMMQEIMYANTDKSISKEEFFKEFSFSTDNPQFLGETPENMCCLVTLEFKTDTGSAMINFQLNELYILELCREANMFEKETDNLFYLDNIKSSAPTYNVYAEFGRYKINDFKFEPGSIFVIDKRIRDELLVNMVFENKVVHTALPVVIDTNFGLQIKQSELLNEITYDEENYIAIRLGEAELSENEVNALKDGYYVMLNTTVDTHYPVSIIQNGKKIAKGEIVVTGDNFAVRIMK